MKLHEFGLWFGRASPVFDVCSDLRPRTWSSSIPENESFFILYDGKVIGIFYKDFCLQVLIDEPHIMKMKYKFPMESYFIEIGRPLTLDDFKIIPNHRYKGPK